MPRSRGPASLALSPRACRAPRHPGRGEEGRAHSTIRPSLWASAFAQRRTKRMPGGGGVKAAARCGRFPNVGRPTGPATCVPPHAHPEPPNRALSPTTGPPWLPHPTSCERSSMPPPCAQPPTVPRCPGRPTLLLQTPHLLPGREISGPSRAAHSWLTIKILQVTIMLCRRSREERQGRPLASPLPPPLPGGPDFRPSQTTEGMAEGARCQPCALPALGTGSRGPHDPPSWVPREKPGAEAHVGTPTGQGQSCPPPLHRGAPGNCEAGSSGVILEETLKARAIKGQRGAVSNVIEI